MLSAQTTDVNVNRVTETLFVKYRTPEDYLAVPHEELERDIFPTGFFRQKAKSLRGTMRLLLEEFDGEVPRTLRGAAASPGVARKTANVVSAERGEPAGDRRRHPRPPALAAPRPDEAGGSGARSSATSMRLVPRADWARFPHLLIWHGRRVCVARAPRCEDCVLNDLCPSSRVESHDLCQARKEPLYSAWARGLLALPLPGRERDEQPAVVVVGGEEVRHDVLRPSRPRA